MSTAATPAKTEKVPQFLTIEPKSELVFCGPFKDVVTAILKLSNPLDKKVCFKVKTTAPERYRVRPNCGLIEPNESVNVSVTLQPFDYEDKNRNNRDRFLIQSIIPTGDLEDIQPADVGSLWKSLPERYPRSDSKLKCVFRMLNEAIPTTVCDPGFGDDLSNKVADASIPLTTKYHSLVNNPLKEASPQPTLLSEVNGITGMEDMKTHTNPKPAPPVVTKPISVESGNEASVLEHRKTPPQTKPKVQKSIPFSDIKDITRMEDMKTPFEPKPAPPVVTKPVSVESGNKAPVLLYRKTPPQTKPKPKVQKSIRVPTQRNFPADVISATTVEIQVCFMVGVVLALLIGVILGKFVV